MRVHVRLFGALAEQAGMHEDELELPEGARAGDALARVVTAHPRTRGIAGRLSLAVNLEVVPAEHPLAEGDQVALLPPVAGGASRLLTGLRPDGLRVEEALAFVAARGAGGTVMFLGSVREEAGRVERLEYSAYAEMAERVLEEIAREAAEKWALEGVAILHAVGELPVGAPTVVVACSSAHRGEAFEACRFGIDEVKRRVPVWKKEIGPSGERWIGLEDTH